MRKLLLLVALGVPWVGCYDSHDATGCAWEGRRYADGEMWDVTRGHHLACHDGMVVEATIDWDYVDYPDAGSDGAR